MADKSCPTVVVTVKGKMSDIIDAVRKEAKKDGVDFKGDENSGTFSGPYEITGIYSVKGQTIKIDYKTDAWFHDKVCKGAREELEAYFKGK